MAKFSRRVTIGDIITCGVVMLVWLGLSVYAVVERSFPLLIITAALTALFCTLFIVNVVRYLRNKKIDLYYKTVAETQALVKQFNDRFDVELGQVCFIHQNLKFTAKGKFACVKDFNGERGYHLAFYIEGTELVSTPENYDDVINYRDTLFTVEIGYFEGNKLSQPENDRGVVVDDVSDLKGKTVKITADGGYIACVRTAETDDIDTGEITFEEWDENSHVIYFKLFVSCGVSDIIVGRLQLPQDTE